MPYVEERSTVPTTTTDGGSNMTMLMTFLIGIIIILVVVLVVLHSVLHVF
jgi:uncharacterized protein HemY